MVNKLVGKSQDSLSIVARMTKYLRLARRRTGWLVLILVGASLVLTVAAFVSGSQQIQPGQVVDKLGEYRFPGDSRQLKITKDDSGWIRVAVRHQTTRFFCIPWSYWEVRGSFESERDWFVSVDQYDRLWIYHGHWNRAWGKKLRQTRSGGTIPYSADVFLHGFFFHGRKQTLGYGSAAVTSVSRLGWTGVPQQFFDRLPDRGSAQWGNGPAIPQEAPQFTHQQHMQVTQLRSAN